MPIGMFKAVMSIGQSSGPIPPSPPLIWSPRVRYLGTPTTNWTWGRVGIGDNSVVTAPNALFGANGYSTRSDDNAQTFVQTPAFTAAKVDKVNGRGVRMCAHTTTSRELLLSYDGFITAAISTGTPLAQYVTQIISNNIGDFASVEMSVNRFYGYDKDDNYVFNDLTSIYANATNKDSHQFPVAITDDYIYYLVKEAGVDIVAVSPISAFRNETMLSNTAKIFDAPNYNGVFCVGNDLFAVKGKGIYKWNGTSLDLIDSLSFTYATLRVSSSDIGAVIGDDQGRAYWFDGTALTDLPNSLDSGDTNGSFRSISNNGKDWICVTTNGFASMALNEDQL